MSKDTLFEYFSYLSDAFAVFSLPVFRNSVREEMRNPKKTYDIGNPKTRERELDGLVEALNFFDCDQGHLLTGNHEETLSHKGKTMVHRGFVGSG